MNSMEQTRAYLRSLGLPGGDAYDLPTSEKRFKDGGQYRFEVPGIQGPKVMRALLEAEAYDGPSLVICYAPCINHGIKKGMGKSQENIKDAVESGYWHLYRYNPERKDEGKNPFILDSAEPTASFKDFIMGQIRYSSLAKEFPSIADKLFDQVEEDARQKYETYKALAENEKALF